VPQCTVNGEQRLGIALCRSHRSGSATTTDVTTDWPLALLCSTPHPCRSDSSCLPDRLPIQAPRGPKRPQEASPSPPAPPMTRNSRSRRRARSLLCFVLIALSLERELESRTFRFQSCQEDPRGPKRPQEGSPSPPSSCRLQALVQPASPCSLLFFVPPMGSHTIFWSLSSLLVFIVWRFKTPGKLEIKSVIFISRIAPFGVACYLQGIKG
jgi:hypothetical protein